MRPEAFFRRLENNKENYCKYNRKGLIGMISVWKYESIYVLNWEEFKEDDFYNENEYTKDEHHEFGSIDELIDFLSKNSLSIESFTPK